MNFGNYSNNSDRFHPFIYNGFMISKENRSTYRVGNNRHIDPINIVFTPTPELFHHVNKDELDEMFYKTLESISKSLGFKLVFFIEEGDRLTLHNIEPKITCGENKVHLGAKLNVAYNDAIMDTIFQKYDFINSVISKDMVFITGEHKQDVTAHKKCGLCRSGEFKTVMEKLGFSDPDTAKQYIIDQYRAEYSLDKYSIKVDYCPKNAMYGNIFVLNLTLYPLNLKHPMFEQDIDDFEFMDDDEEEMVYTYYNFLKNRAEILIDLLLDDGFNLNDKTDESPVEREIDVLEYQTNGTTDILTGSYVFRLKLLITTSRIGRSYYPWIPAEGVTLKELETFYPRTTGDYEIRYFDLIGSYNLILGDREAYYIPTDVEFNDRTTKRVFGKESLEIDIKRLNLFYLNDSAEYPPMEEVNKIQIKHARYLEVYFKFPFYKVVRHFFDKLTTPIIYFFEIAKSNDIDAKKAAVKLIEVLDFFKNRNVVIFPLTDSIGLSLFQNKNYAKMFELYDQIPFVISDRVEVNQKHPSNSGLCTDLEELRCLWS